MNQMEPRWEEWLLGGPNILHDFWSFDMVASVNDALCLAEILNLFSEATLCVSGGHVTLQESSSHDTVQSQCFAE